MNSLKNITNVGIRVFFTGVGGQGTLLATRLVGEAALKEGLPVTISEIHGMAQRGGVVESSVAIGNILARIVPSLNSMPLYALAGIGIWLLLLVLGDLRGDLQSRIGTAPSGTL